MLSLLVYSADYGSAAKQSFCVWLTMDTLATELRKVPYQDSMHPLNLLSAQSLSPHGKGRIG